MPFARALRVDGLLSQSREVSTHKLADHTVNTLGSLKIAMLDVRPACVHTAVVLIAYAITGEHNDFRTAL